MPKRCLFSPRRVSHEYGGPRSCLSMTCITSHSVFAISYPSPSIIDNSKMEEDYQLVDYSDTMAGPQAPATLGTITHAKPFARVIDTCSDSNPKPLSDPNLILSAGLDNVILDHAVPTQLSRFGMVQSRHRVGGPNFLPFGGGGAGSIITARRYASEQTAFARTYYLDKIYGMIRFAGLTPLEVRV